MQVTIASRFGKDAADLEIRVQQPSGYAYYYGEGGDLVFPQHVSASRQKLSQPGRPESWYNVLQRSKIECRARAGCILEVGGEAPGLRSAYRRFAWVDPPLLSRELLNPSDVAGPRLTISHHEIERLPNRLRDLEYSFVYGDEGVALFSSRPGLFRLVPRCSAHKKCASLWRKVWWIRTNC
jgi:hypothetical protein